MPLWFVVVLYLSVGAFVRSVVPLLRSSICFCPCLPRVSYRASPLFHPGLCRSVAPLGLIVPFFCVFPGFHIGLCPYFTLGYAVVSPRWGSLHAFAVFPGFHIGLCPHSTLGYAGVPPLQGSLPYWTFAELCRGIVFVKCFWVCKWIVAFVRVFV